MDINIILKGLILGFSIAAPVGPIGVLCIRRTLSDGRAIGFASGLGAATADGLYGCLAAFGVTLITNVLIGQQLWLRLIGGAFLIYLGVRTFFAKPTGQVDSPKTQGLAGAYFSTFFLTLSNPMTILSFTAVFAGVGIGVGASSYLSAGQLVLGVFIGSALWWLLLSSGTSLLRSRFNDTAMQWINRISGIVIFTFGMLALVSLIQ